MTQTDARSRGSAVGAAVNFSRGRGDLPMLEIRTPWSEAHIYLQGAHVTHFKRRGEPPLLFLSAHSRFESGHPIRGGIPVIFPWFGAREGLGMHGFVRNKTWELNGISFGDTGAVTARFALPNCPEAANYPAFALEYQVTVDQSLTAELIVTNRSTRTFECEACLHTYFAVGDITATTIEGLKGVDYLDKVQNFARQTETNDVIRFSSEVDRVYVNTTGTVKIHDAGLGRVIHVKKENSESTVVWNPWIDKAEKMPDFGNDEYQRMVCVESGNVMENGTRLAPGETSRLAVRLQ